ncbi:Alpha/Beta hydrolase protein [Phycomyces nitens]|nr:Alpha/Beta hydrolase protein [Phycomyces nitens]
MYGLALNASSIDLGSSYNGLSRRSNVFATDSQVAELKPSTQLAANSYCRSVIPFSKWSCKHCSKDETLVKTFKSSKWDTNGFVSRNDKTKVITLVFRGSSSIRNAIADIKLSLAEYPPVVDAKVHNGFYQSYTEVQKEVLSTMFKEISAYPDYKIVVTGHSLGAATAVLAALDLFQRDDRFNSKNLSIITYGEPRVGNPAFAYYMTGTGIRHDRVVHKQDLVAHIPSKRLGYLHSGVEYWNIIGDTVKICADELDSDDCSNSIVPFTSFLDHATYLKINTGFCL